MALSLDNLLPLMPPKGVAEAAIDRWRSDKAIGLSKAEVVDVLQHGARHGKLKESAVRNRRHWAVHF